MRNNLTRRTSIWTHFSCDRALNSFIKIRSAMAAPAFDLLPLSGSPRREGRQTGGGGFRFVPEEGPEGGTQDQGWRAGDTGEQRGKGRIVKVLSRVNGVSG